MNHELVTEAYSGPSAVVEVSTIQSEIEDCARGLRKRWRTGDWPRQRLIVSEIAILHASPSCEIATGSLHASPYLWV